MKHISNSFKVILILLGIFCYSTDVFSQCVTPVITSISNTGPVLVGGSIVLSAKGTVAGNSSSFIRMAGIGGNNGNHAFNEVFSSHDRAGSIDRISNAQFDAIFSGQPTYAGKASALRAKYDILMFTWASPNDANINWPLITAYLNAGGGVFVDGDYANVVNLYDGTSSSVRGSQHDEGGGCVYTIVSPAPFPALAANGVNGCFVNNHLIVSSFPSWMSAYITRGSENQAVAGIYPYGEHGRLIVQGPDQDYHAMKGMGDPGANQYQMILNQLDFMSANQAGFTWTGPNGFSSNDASPVISSITAAQGGVYTAKLTNTAEGGCFTTATTTVVVNSPTPPPIISDPGSYYAATNPGQCGAVVNYNIGVTDAYGRPVVATMTYSNPSGSLFLPGTTVVTVTATNAGGSASKTFTITVKDYEAPHISTVAAMTVANGSSVLPGITGNPVVSDNCTAASDIVVSYKDDSSPGSYGGLITRTWTAKDAEMNVSTSVQAITINPAALPVLVDLANITVENGGLPAASTITYTNGLGKGALITGTSNTSTRTATPGSYGGTVTETWTSSDSIGRVLASVSRVITINPAALPLLVDLPDLTVENGGLPAATTISYTNGLGTGALISGISLVSTRTPTPDAYGGTVTETWTSSDSIGRVLAPVFRTITINPAALPTMNMQDAATISVACGDVPVPSTISFTNGLGTGALISGTSNASTFATVPGTCGGFAIETWTASDRSGGRMLASVSRTVTISQNLGSIESFVMFSGSGAVSNAGSSKVTGDVGSDAGAVSGFGPSAPGYGSYSSSSVTIQAKKDLLNLYIHLSNIPVTNTVHAAAYGSGESLIPGVYAVGGAGSLAGKLILDGQGNSNAVFIFKFSGAFSAAAGSVVMLTNGIRACNVFWVAEGAITVGASGIMKGTLLGHTGAVSVAAGANLEGRMLSTVGAVSFGPGVASLPMGPSTLPVICVNPSNMAILGSTTGFALFSSAGAVSNTGSSGFIGAIGTNAGALTGFGTSATTLVGATQVANSVTVKAKADLQTAYSQLKGMAATTAHGAAFGSGEVLLPGVYNMAAAGSLAGTLILNGQGNPNSVFIFKFGGAFTTAVGSKVILVNGAVHSNVYWVAEGAISMGAMSFMKGALIAHNGANSMGAGGNIEGRMFSTAGAVSFNAGVGYISYSLCENPQDVSASSMAFSPVSSFIQSLTEKELTIFPNPTRGLINLNYQGDVAGVRSIEIFTITGRLVYASGNYQSTINLRRLTAGIYFVNVHTNTKTISRKIIVD